MSRPNFDDTKDDFAWMNKFYENQRIKARARGRLAVAYEDFINSKYTEEFDIFAEREYGIKVTYYSEEKRSGFTGYEIIDESKHSWFLLKYSK